MRGGPELSRLPPDVRLPRQSEAGLRRSLHNYAPGSAGNEVHDTDKPRRPRIRARHSWNPAVTDVIVNTRSHIGVLGRRHTVRSRWCGIRVHFERNTQRASQNRIARARGYSFPGSSNALDDLRSVL
jgi:hypothetical protein